MRDLRLALILPAALALGACASDGMDGLGSSSSTAVTPAPVTPGRVMSSNPSAVPVSMADPAAAAAAANATGGPPV